MFVKANFTTGFHIENYIYDMHNTSYIYMHKNSYYQVYNDAF